MAVVLVKNKISQDDLKKAQEEYGDFVKVDIDFETGAMAIGGKWHADGEKLLLQNGSKQPDIWGGGVNLQTKMISYNSLINTKPLQDNPSQEILDKQVRQKFAQKIKDKFEL